MNINTLFTALAAGSQQSRTSNNPEPDPSDAPAATILPSAPPAPLSTGVDNRMEQAQNANQAAVKPVLLTGTPLVTALARQTQAKSDRRQAVAECLGVPAKKVLNAFEKGFANAPPGTNPLDSVADELGVHPSILHHAMRVSGMKLIDRRA